MDSSDNTNQVDVVTPPAPSEPSTPSITELDEKMTLNDSTPPSSEHSLQQPITATTTTTINPQQVPLPGNSEVEEHTANANLPCNSMKLMNNSARISSFQMSDGPLGISLNVYDGKSLKSLVATLLDTVNDQAKTIKTYERRFQELSDRIESNYQLQEEKADGIENSLKNLAQNIQGFVDEDGAQPEAPINSKLASPVNLRSPTPQNPNSHSSFEIVKSSPVNIADLPPKSPETVDPPASFEPIVFKEKKDTLIEDTLNPEEEPPETKPDPLRSKRSIETRARFKKAVKKVIMQIRMKNMCVGVLTSRAGKGMSIGERLKSLEDLLYGRFKGVEVDIKEMSKQAELDKEVGERRSERCN